ncbi:MAG: dolichyl-phosphate beta-glucosyltransferase [Patescibacteria group bacterium]
MMNQDIYLSIVIPAYNEAHRISDTLITTHKYLDRQPYRSEIIVIDDASTDTTIDVVKSLFYKIPNLRVIRHRKNQGKGAAIRTGALNLRGQFMLFMDADLATPIEEIDKLLPHVTDYEVIIASRHIKKDSIKTRQSWYRQLFSRIGNYFIQQMLLPGIKDTQCGFKLFSQKAAYDLFSRLTVTRFGFDIEILSLAATLDYRLKEVAVSWYDRPRGSVNIIRDGWRVFLDVVQIKSRLINSLLHKTAYTQKV